MHGRKNTLIAVYEAVPEHSHFESPVLLTRVRALGRAFTEWHLGIIARMGPAVISTLTAALSESKTSSILLSPAANSAEHTRAFRLPIPAMFVVYTGRGALGADMMALASAGAVVIVGSFPKVFEAIIDHAKDATVPIGVLSDEEPSAIHERVRARHPHMTSVLFISHDPAVLVRELAEELRRRELNHKLG